MRKYIDDFSKLSIDKMAQAIEDMTYIYEETRVPKSHYKKLLDKQLEELIADSVEVNLLAPYVSTIKSLLEQSPKAFFKALLCVDKKITVSNMRPAELQALNVLYHEFEADKQYKGYLPPQILHNFDEISKYGLNNYFSDDDMTN